MLNGYDMRQGEAAAPTLLISEPMAFHTSGYGASVDDQAQTLQASDARLSNQVSGVLTSSTEGSPARTSAWPAGGPVFGASAAVSGLNSSGLCASCGHDGSPLKMFPDSFPATGEPTSVSYYGGWSTSGTAWPGGLWTHAGSESPRDAVACSLSAVLETRPVPRRYWLSARAAAGILRRAEKRGKTLPPRLLAALETLAATARTTAQTDSR
jgi:hypothetical protein